MYHHHVVEYTLYIIKSCVCRVRCGGGIKEGGGGRAKGPQSYNTGFEEVVVTNLVHMIEGGI